MSCRGCTKSFGLFSREHGCEKCKLCFCSKCLKYTIKDTENRKLTVCLRCYELNKTGMQHEVAKATASSTETVHVNDPTEHDPNKPENHREESESITPSTDEDLTRRLQTLKKDDGPLNKIPTDTEIEIRLANLRNLEYKEYKSKIKFLPDNRTDTQKTEDLIKQFLEEDEIAKNMPDPDEKILSRLNALKADRENAIGSTAAASTNIVKVASADEPDIESEDEEIATKKLIKKYTEEAALTDFKLEDDEKEFLESIPKPSGDNEELPWCTVCNEDAVIRCLGCDMELFCRLCFAECHDDDEEYRQHKTKPYRKPKDHD